MKTKQLFWNSRGGNRGLSVATNVQHWLISNHLDQNKCSVPTNTFQFGTRNFRKIFCFRYDFSKKHILGLEVPKRWVCHNRDCDTSIILIECIDLNLNRYPKIQIRCQHTLGTTILKISFLIWLGCICINYYITSRFTSKR